ncbi:MAG: TlpA disulfide reductase family protein, partial [Phycisphaerae bacterium]
TVAQKPEEKQKQKRPAEEMVGQAAPKFELTTTAGKKVSNEALAGTVTVLDFFSKTCGHCSRQIPRVEQIRKTYEEKGVRFIAVGSGGTDEEIKEKVDQLGYQGELAIDSNRAASSAFKVRGVPSMAILGKTGKVEAVNVGNVGDLETRMKGQLDALLAGKPVPEFASAAPPKPRKRPAEDMAGKPAPAFSLKTADGKTFSNAALASYPATVLNFVAPNCGFSKRQVTKVETVRAEYEQKGVRFVNVNQTFRKPYSAEEALEVFKGVGSNLELVYDDEANTVGNTFKATGYPTMFVVDKEGKIAHVNIGANPNIDTILKEQLDGLIK